MPKYETGRFLTGDLSGHPAVAAWVRLRQARSRPASVAVLKERHDGKEARSAVYRLAGVGLAETDVIAKRCLRPLAALETTIYEEVLPSVPVPILAYYGTLDEPGSEFSWIFVQDAGQQALLPHSARHRAAAATWLGIVHVSTQRLPPIPGLPHRDLASYREHLETARQLILGYLDRAPGAVAETEALVNLLRLAERLEREWSRLRALCDAIPATFVHGDFVARNIRLRANGDQLIVLPFDWEWSGWGTPAIDLAQSALGSTRNCADPDLTTYWMVVGDHWPGIEAHTVRRLAVAGTLLRLLNAVYWAALGLSYEWMARSVRNLTVYEGGMARALQAWDSGAGGQ